MKLKNCLFLFIAALASTKLLGQVTTLEDFSNTMRPSQTYFWGSFSSSGIVDDPLETPSAGISQGAGFFTIGGATNNNADTSKLEIFFDSAPLNLTGNTFLVLTAEALSTNAAPSLRVYLYDTLGRGASATFTAGTFVTGSFTTAVQALSITPSGFNYGAVESMVITGDVQNGTARFNFNFDNLAVAASAIPEPSTYAAIFGALALAFVAYRRRQKAA